MRHGRVVRVINGKRGVEPEQAGFAAQDARAGAVKRADPDPPAPSRCQGFDPLLHLAGGLVGERQGQDALRRHALRQQIADAARDDARLARAGPGDDQQRAFDVRDGRALLIVYVLEQFVDCVHHFFVRESAARMMDFTGREDGAQDQPAKSIS